MTLKIERFRARVRLSGEVRSEHLDQVKAEIDCCGTSAVLDIEEVDLVDVEGVRFLNACDANGISVVQEELPTHMAYTPVLLDTGESLLSSLNLSAIGYGVKSCTTTSACMHVQIAKKAS